MGEERLPVFKAGRRYRCAHDLKIHRAARIGQYIEMLAVIAQAIFAACLTRGDRCGRRLRLGRGDKPDLSRGMVMGANLNEITAIALADGDEKSRVAFFIDEAGPGRLVMNVLSKDSVRALIIVTLNPEQSRIIQRPLQPAGCFGDTG